MTYPPREGDPAFRVLLRLASTVDEQINTTPPASAHFSCNITQSCTLTRTKSRHTYINFFFFLLFEKREGGCRVGGRGLGETGYVGWRWVRLVWFGCISYSSYFCDGAHVMH